MKAMGNGSSEMVSNLASAITTTLFNLQMMALVGEKGVAAISAILYLQFIFIAVFFGFVSGISPVVSYNYGAENRDNIKKTFNISIKIVVIFSGTSLPWRKSSTDCWCGYLLQKTRSFRN